MLPLQLTIRFEPEVDSKHIEGRTLRLLLEQTFGIKIEIHFAIWSSRKCLRFSESLRRVFSSTDILVQRALANKTI
jgi:hypothetical protein